MPKRTGQAGGSFAMSNEHRVKIQNSNVLNALIEHAEGVREMAPSQVTAALGLLRKVMPDLAAVEHSGEVSLRSAVELGDDELAAIVAGEDRPVVKKNGAVH